MAISQRTRFNVLKRDGYTCQYCGQKAPDVELEVDHIFPRKEGGKDEDGNLITACSPCNRGKSAQILPGTRPFAPYKSFMVGKFCHTFHANGRVEYQGQIIAEDVGYVLLETFDWITGSRGFSHRVFPKSAVSDWYFYDTAEQMQHSYEYSGIRDGKYGSDYISPDEIEERDRDERELRLCNVEADLDELKQKLEQRTD